MARQIAAGIDIGTFETKVVIAEEVSDGRLRRQEVIGTGLAASSGLTRGYITDSDEVARSIKIALTQAEKMAKVKVRRAYFSVGGIGLESVTTTGFIMISRADLEITERDLEAVMLAAETAIPHAVLINRKIINSIPVEYKIDGKPVWGRVDGLKAQKLEVKALFLTALVHHLEDIVAAAETAGVEVIDIFAAPVAASFVTLSKKQKRAGCLLANIGAETISLVTFENDNLLSLEVLPMGGTDLTHDIALGLKVPIEEAENIKTNTFSRISYSKKKLDEIISARLKHMFLALATHLKKIGRDGLLPAGIILTGGSSNIEGLKLFAEELLGLPAMVAEIRAGDGEKNRVRDNIWSVACGLSLVGFVTGSESGIMGPRQSLGASSLIKRLWHRIWRLISQVLP